MEKNIPKEVCESEDINYCLYVDTDSTYIHFYPYLKHINPDFDSLPENKKEDLLEQEALKYQDLINEHYDTLAKDIFNIQEEHHFEMKTEAVISSAYFRATRRYAQWIKKKEGVPTDELDVKGLEYRKTNFPPLFGDFVEKILEQILKGQNKDVIDKQLLEFKQRLLDGEFKIEDISNPTSVKTFDNYLESKPKGGEIFSKTKIRAPAAVKASYAYNDLLRYWKVEKRYPIITQSQKIKWIYLSDNPYKLEAIAFIEGLVPPQIREFIENYVDYGQVFDKIILNKVKGLYDDLGWSLVLNPFVNDFFEF